MADYEAQEYPLPGYEPSDGYQLEYPSKPAVAYGIGGGTTPTPVTVRTEPTLPRRDP